MKSIISISDFSVQAIIGVYPEERKKLQEILVDVDLTVDVSCCFRSDSLKETIDYDKVVMTISELFSHEHYHLIERFAYELALRLFKQFPIFFAKVRIKKTAAIPQAKYASVTLEMAKEEFLCHGP